MTLEWTVTTFDITFNDVFGLSEDLDVVFGIAKGVVYTIYCMEFWVELCCGAYGKEVFVRNVKHAITFYSTGFDYSITITYRIRLPPYTHGTFRTYGFVETLVATIGCAAAFC
ncbi:hypothetical protein UFOVP1319_19 [uncultured Caudovirales phage]|uniref:Uncharacterized protein n=1 Tax=uncultured Caudovirales phage TaxID=2100421 RepID=A0A6J5MJQ3_9CAUD|nr:hypothetical protein UFOVP478_2 [uncultured Caudovirales phage]CAB4191376.1 hypothetical protein UFOVP1225_29 [uncultured Caudovirales phage]CAB4197519.1 hypothetical protein UFOVP1319_19 [uncultured Caudovirales phage]CAB4217445.1 hypothetical protein UFOVP1591_29 [uncultured Caudovirales phage]